MKFLRRESELTWARSQALLENLRLLQKRFVKYFRRMVRMKRIPKTNLVFACAEQSASAASADRKSLNSHGRIIILRRFRSEPAPFNEPTAVDSTMY
jgi:hypothetical protein